MKPVPMPEWRAAFDPGGNAPHETACYRDCSLDNAVGWARQHAASMSRTWMTDTVHIEIRDLDGRLWAEETISYPEGGYTCPVTGLHFGNPDNAIDYLIEHIAYYDHIDPANTSQGWSGMTVGETVAFLTRALDAVPGREDWRPR